MDVAASEATEASRGPAVEANRVRRICGGTSGQREPSRPDGTGPTTRGHGGSRCREYFNLVDPVSGKDVHIKTSEPGDVDLGPRRVLAGAVSGSRAWDCVESALGLFSKGRELEIMLREYKEASLIPKADPLSP